MRILAITSSNSGVGYHRIIMPIVNMQKDYCLMTDTLSEETFEGNYDIVVMNRMLANITPEQMDAWRTKYGFKLVVDNDDYWYLDPSHILHERYVLNNISQQMKTEQVYLNFVGETMQFTKKLFSKASFKFAYGANAKDSDNTGIKFSML